MDNDPPKNPAAYATGYAIVDSFNGDTEHLRDCIKALLELDAAGALVPHGIGGHARALLSACYHRLHNKPELTDAPTKTQTNKETQNG